MKKGISLIVLVITIIVIIILASIVILSIANNNPINAANESVFKNDLDAFRTELLIYNTSEYASSGGTYNQSTLQAGPDEIGNIIASLKDNKKYEGKLYIENGELKFVCTGTKEDEWAGDIGIEVNCIESEISISEPEPPVVNSNNDVKYTVTVLSSYPITNVVEENIKAYRVKTQEEEQDTELTDLLTFNYIDDLSEDGKYIKLIDITVETSTLTDGNYYIKVLPDTIVTEIGGKESRNKTEKVSSTFEVNNVVPQAPDILPSTTDPTNQDITVTIRYNGEEQNTRRYKVGENDWLETTEQEIVLTISSNALIIATDINTLGTPSSNSLDITNIDKNPPIVTLTDAGKTSSSITVQAVATDVGNSGINENSYEYSKDNGLTWDSPTSLTTYTYSNLTAGTYNIKVRVKDNAGNVGTSASTLTITTESLGTITMIPSTTAWTNQNVTVTISYPTAVVTKEYKIGSGGTWTAYTGAVTVSSNNTIYARGFDSASNQTEQATLIIDKIDKTGPSITASSNGVTSTTVSVKATASDSGSGLNTSSYQYSRDNGATWTSATTTTTYTFTGLANSTTYQCKVKVRDNVGNETISSTVAIATTAYIVSNPPVTGCGGTPLTVNSTINGQLPSYNNPIIPAGFVPLNTPDASWNISGGVPQGWNNGLVIQDANCNEFVWVPIDGVNVKYERNLSYPYSSNMGTTPTASNMDDAYIPEMEASKYNVLQYKGFYVGRYETFNDGGKAGIKKGRSAWILNFNNSYSRSANMAENNGYNTAKVDTNLITGLEWDAIMSWITNSGKNVRDSRSWGNHDDSTSPANVYGYGSVQVTGYSEAWKIKNIYDLAGNNMEVTAEVQIIGSTVGFTLRGGYYNASGSSVPISYRVPFADFESSANARAFRVALYIL